MSFKPLVLSVDDEEGDRFLMAHKFRGKGSPVHLQQVDSAANAMAYLDGAGQFAERYLYPLPDLLLLDIKMPVLDGFDVLRFVRAHSVHQYLPAIMLTSSDSPHDRTLAAELGADGYLVKDGTFKQPFQALQAIARAWPQAAPLPLPPLPNCPPSSRHSSLSAREQELLGQTETRLAASAKRLTRSMATLADRRELVAHTLFALNRSYGILGR